MRYPGCARTGVRHQFDAPLSEIRHEGIRIGGFVSISHEDRRRTESTEHNKHSGGTVDAYGPTSPSASRSPRSLWRPVARFV